MSNNPLFAGISALALLACMPSFAADNPAAANPIVKAFVDGDVSAFPRGEPVRLFADHEAVTRNTLGAGLQMQLESFVVDYCVVLLPKGVMFLTGEGPPAVGHWRAVSGGFEGTLAGNTFALRLGRARNGKTILVAPRRTFWEVPAPSDGSIIGRYVTVYASGGGGGPLFAQTSTYGKKALLLTQDHHYQFSSAGSTTVSGKNYTAYVGRDGVARGTWRYEPASFTLILQPEGGKPTIAGVTFPASGTDWTIIGRSGWWRETQAQVAPSK